MNNFLTVGQVKEYKWMRNSSLAEKRDRIQAIMILKSGYSQIEIAKVLLLDEGTIWRWVDLYKNSRLQDPLIDNYKGGTAKLNAAIKSPSISPVRLTSKRRNPL